MTAWRSRDIVIDQSSAAIADVFRRAERWRLANGGRFDVRDRRTVILWSARRAPGGGRLCPIGSYVLVVVAPDDRVHWRLEWDPDTSNETEIWLGFQLLIGRGAAALT